MSEERLQEIKDSIEFQYTLAKIKGYDNALLFTNEEEELVEEIERLNNIINKARRKLGEYKHYSTPTEEQNKENEDISEEVYQILHENLYEIKN